MIFSEALAALAAGLIVKRTKGNGVSFRLQAETVPILTTGLVTSSGPSVINNNWIIGKYVLIYDIPEGEEYFVRRAPYAFSDEEVSATDWEVVGS